MHESDPELSGSEGEERPHGSDCSERWTIGRRAYPPPGPSCVAPPSSPPESLDAPANCPSELPRRRRRHVIRETSAPHPREVGASVVGDAARHDGDKPDRCPRARRRGDGSTRRPCCTGAVRPQRPGRPGRKRSRAAHAAGCPAGSATGTPDGRVRHGRMRCARSMGARTARRTGRRPGHGRSSRFRSRTGAAGHCGRASVPGQRTVPRAGSAVGSRSRGRGRLPGRGDRCDRGHADACNRRLRGVQNGTELLAGRTRPGSSAQRTARVRLPPATPRHGLRRSSGARAPADPASRGRPVAGCQRHGGSAGRHGSSARRLPPQNRRPGKWCGRRRVRTRAEIRRPELRTCPALRA